MNKVYYSQVDSRWTNYPYPSPSLPNATVGSGGCGATCGAMIVSMLKEIVLPDAMAQKFVDDGIRVDGGTSNEAFNTYLTKEYGLKVNLKYKLDEAVECLKAGGIVVALCNQDTIGTVNLFTTGGHFITLVGYENDTFEIYDPYLYTNKFTSYGRSGKATVSGTTVYVKYQDMKDYGGYNQLWCYDATNVDTNEDTSVVVPSYTEKTVSVNTSLNIRKSASTSASIVGSLKNGDTVKVYSESNGWAKIEQGYVSSTYLKTSSTSYTLKTVTASSGLRVRSSASTSASIVTTYKCGTVVKVYSTSGNWSKGTKGWMYSTYLK